jgi:hypothetical protein
MRKYITRDGLRISGRNAAEVIDSMRQASHLPQRTLREYMLETSRAAAMQTGGEFNGDTAELLLAGLLGAGLVKTACQTCWNPPKECTCPAG